MWNGYAMFNLTSPCSSAGSCNTHFDIQVSRLSHTQIVLTWVVGHFGRHFLFSLLTIKPHGPFHKNKANLANITQTTAQTVYNRYQEVYCELEFRHSWCLKYSGQPNNFQSPAEIVECISSPFFQQHVQLTNISDTETVLTLKVQLCKTKHTARLVVPKFAIRYYFR